MTSRETADAMLSKLPKGKRLLLCVDVSDQVHHNGSNGVEALASQPASVSIPGSTLVKNKLGELRLVTTQARIGVLGIRTGGPPSYLLYRGL